MPLPRNASPKRFPVIRFSVAIFLVCGVIASALFVTLLTNKSGVYEEVVAVTNVQAVTANAPLPFPLSVNPRTKTITENPGVNTYLDTFLAYEAVKPERDNWWRRITYTLAMSDWYQNLASPMSRILVIWPGERVEEISHNFGRILRWDETEKATFVKLITEQPPLLPDGTFFPGRYVTGKDATPELVAQLVRDRFANEVTARYPESVAAIVPLKDALIVASLLEREAREFEQMREISGVIWNRLFIDMPLQLDATLQYAKANNPNEPDWWPAVVPNDKFIDSPFNTYQNKGLPPSPIANPSASSILAALNPIETDCLFYFHDSNGAMYCSVSYEEHVSKLRSIYGQGR